MTSNEKQLAVPGKTYRYYVDQYKIKHAEGYTEIYQLSPSFNSKHRIKEMLEKCEAKTLLDYGISSGTQYEVGRLHEYLELDSYAGYDPAVEKYNQKPQGKFDAVLCYDVLEHVPEDSIDYVIQDIFSYVDKVALFKMGLGKATAVLPNGENAHITIKPLDWWKEKISQHKPDGIAVYVHNELI